MRSISLDDEVYRVCQDGGGGSFKTVVLVKDSGASPNREPKGELLSGVNRLLAASPRAVPWFPKEAP